MQIGLKSILILKTSKLKNLNEYYCYMTWLVILVSLLITVFSLICVNQDFQWPIEPNKYWFTVRLEFYGYPIHKYWLSFINAIVAPPLIIYLYWKSFNVVDLIFPKSAGWLAITVIFLAGMLLVYNNYFGLDGEEGYFSRGTATTLIGIYLMSHLSLLGLCFTLVIPAIYLTRKLGNYHGRKK